MSAQQSKVSIFTNGIIKENPVLRLVLGTCPTLAVTTAAFNGLGMGAAATFVLIGSNMVISALRKVIPDKVRLPAYITVIATFVTIVQMLVKAYAQDLYAALGVFLPLIVVNCIILGRAEMFASKHNVVESALDGLGMGIGFTFTLLLMSSIREIFGAGSIFGVTIIPEEIDRISIMTTPPGGFLTFGVLMALVIFVETKLGQKKKRAIGCEGCPSAANCHGKGGCN